MANARDAYKRGNNFFSRAKTVEQRIHFNDQGHISNPKRYWESEQLYDEAMTAYIEFLDFVGDSRLRELSNINGPFNPEQFKRKLGYLYYAASRRACEHINAFLEAEHCEQIEDICDGMLSPKEFMARLESAKPLTKNKKS